MKSFGNIAKDSEIRAVASGTLPSGKPVVVNSDGTVSVVATAAPTAATASAITDTASNDATICYDPDNQKVVIAWYDAGNNDYGTAVVGTVNPANNTISYGSEVVFNAGQTRQNGIVYDSNSNKVVIVYRDAANSGYGTAIVGTVSGTSISFGTEVVFNSGSTSRIGQDGICFDSTNNKVVIAYADIGSGTSAIVGTVSGTSISFGSEHNFQNNTAQGLAITHDSQNNRIVIVMGRSEGGINQTKVRTGTISGTSITVQGVDAAQKLFDQKGGEKAVIAEYIGNGKTIVAFNDFSDDEKGFVDVVSLSGDTFTVNADDDAGTLFDEGDVGKMSSAFVASTGQVIITYNDEDTDNSHFGKFVVVTNPSGLNVEVTSPVTFESAEADFTAVAYDSNAERAVVAYQDQGNSSLLTANILTPGGANLTSENYIGMSRGVVKDTSLSQANGTPVEYGDENTAYQSATFDSNSNKVVVAFRGTSDHGKAVVGTVNGTDNSISFGTVVTFEAAAQLNNAITFDSSNNKVVIAYRDEGNSNYGTAIVGTVSGTDISFGSPVVFNTGRSDSISIAFDSSNNKVVIAYRDNGNSNYGTAIVGTVSGTGISFGSEVVFKSATTGVTSTVFDSNSNKVAILYNDGAGKAVVGTVSGTGISFGSEATFESGAVDGLSTAFDSNLNKIVAAYRDEGNSNHGTSAIGTISGTNITFGTPVVFESAGILSTGTAFDTGVNKVNIFYKDGGNSDYGTVIVGTVSGTTISYGTPVVYEEATTSAFAATFDSNSKRVIGVNTDGGNSTKGTAVVFCNAGTIGTVRGEVADGGNAVIDSTNTISRNQIGLTAGQTYFVQNDGTLSETAASPSVTAGTAISATELIVKG